MTFTRRGAGDSKKPGQPAGPLTLTYVRTDPTHLALEGKIGAEHLSIHLERLEAENMLRMTRGFHWISEEPFNR